MNVLSNNQNSLNIYADCGDYADVHIEALVSEGRNSFDGTSIPMWVHELSDPKGVKYHYEGFFFFYNMHDYECGMSYIDDFPPDPTAVRVDYNFGPLFGKLRVVIIAGVPWCSLDDAGRIAGKPTCEITGQVDDEQSNVRGLPGFLNPDGIRCLEKHGISDNGIKLEALIDHVEHRRSEDPRVSTMLDNAIKHVQCHDWQIQMAEIPCINLWLQHHCPIVKGQIHLDRRYYKNTGEFNILWIGTQPWILESDIISFTGINEQSLLQIIHSDRMIYFWPETLYPSYRNSIQKVFVCGNAFKKLYSAMSCNHCCNNHHVIDYLSEYQNKLASPESPKMVLGSSLHGMLGPHLDFKFWKIEFQKRWTTLLPYHKFPMIFSNYDDFSIPLLIARDIAASEGTYAGKIAAMLLTQGGFFHGGPIDETADETLRRFKGIIPDLQGNVQILKIWEFLSCPGNFEDWFAAHKRSTITYDSPDGPLSAASDWCGIVWRVLDSEHYGAVVK